MNSIREHKHRLQPDLYVGTKIISFTKCIKNRAPAFINDSIFSCFESLLKDVLIQNSCDALAYLFMPDHGHFVFRGNTNNSVCLSAMYRFSQKTGFWFTKNLPQIKRQKDFYDHILRNDEDVEKHVR